MKKARILLVLCMVCLPQWSQGELLDLNVFPAEAALHAKGTHQGLVVQGRYDDASTRDVGDEAQWSIAPEGIAQIKDGVLTPLADGAAVVTVKFEGKQQQIPVTVAGSTAERPISFKLDVMPIFLKAGCNTGSCHGSARGQDGFRLSLFGYDP